MSRGNDSGYPEEMRPIFRCEYCKHGIYPGDEYAELYPGKDYHIECLKDMGVCELLGLLGVHSEIANEEDAYDGYNG